MANEDMVLGEVQRLPSLFHFLQVHADRPLPLPIAIEDLPQGRAIGSGRLEFREGYTPDRTFQSV
jgi:hypothetical protein